MEPERQIEKLLRASAKKRRDEAGAPKELHPATRRLLQAEVARRSRKADEGNFFLTLNALFRRKLVFALCVVAVCAVAASFLLPALSKAKSKSTLAFNANKRGTESNQLTAKPVTQAEAPKTPELPMAERPVGTASVDETKALAMNRAVEPTVARDAVADGEKKMTDQPAVPPTGGGGRFGGGGFGGGGGGGFGGRADIAAGQSEVRGLAANSPAAVLTPATASNGAPLLTNGDTRSLELAYSLQAKEPVNFESGAPGLADRAPSNLFNAVTRADANSDAFAARQVFVNTATVVQTQTPAFANTAKRFPVLNNFNVLQRGTELQVVDEDGSVYNGIVHSTNVVPVSTPAGGVAMRREAAAQPTAAQTATAGAQNYYFVVNGMNQSLKENVRFSGNLVVAGNEAQPNLQTNLQLQNQLQIAASNMLIVPLANYRINGTAELGGQKLQIDAVPSTSLKQ